MITFNTHDIYQSDAEPTSTVVVQLVAGSHVASGTIRPLLQLPSTAFSSKCTFLNKDTNYMSRSPLPLPCVRLQIADPAETKQGQSKGPVGGDGNFQRRYNTAQRARQCVPPCEGEAHAKGRWC